MIRNSVVLIALFVVVSTSAAAEPRRPNVLFIVVDDLRPELACYGVEGVISPNIDRLAASGVVFHRAYVQQAVCGPSRASFLSGLRPDSTHVDHNNLMLVEQRPDIVSLPRHFREQGYYTVPLGKLYHHPEDDPLAWSEPDWRPFNMSFGFRDYRREENYALTRRLFEEARAAGREIEFGSVKGPAYEWMDTPDHVYPDGLNADMAVHMLHRLQQQEQPFFLALGFYKPHLPFACPTKYWELYERDQMPLAPNRQPPRDVPEVALVEFDELRQYTGVPQGMLSDEMSRLLVHGYRACVSYVDAQIGRVLDELAAQGLADNTIVVLIGDHGWHLGEQSIWAKQTNFENGTRAPLIVRVPQGTTAGRSTDALVEFVDLYPTLCELAGLPPPAHLEGQSFAPLLTDPERPWKTAAFSQYPRDREHDAIGYSVRTDRYRYTRWVKLGDRSQVIAEELYDHQADPRESANLAGSGDYTAALTELPAALDAGWQAARASRQ